MSRHFSLQLKDAIRPIVIIAHTQNEAFKQAVIESKERNTQIISLIEMHKVDARPPKKDDEKWSDLPETKRPC